MNIVSCVELKVGVSQTSPLHFNNTLYPIGGNPFSYDAFAGLKLTFFSNGEFADKVEVGGDLKINYGTAYAQVGFKNVNDDILAGDSKWAVDTIDPECGLESVSLDKNCNLTINVPIYKSAFVSLDGNIDVTKASEFISSKLMSVYNQMYSTWLELNQIG